MEDTDDVKISQVLLMMLSMPAQQCGTDVCNLCAQLTASSHLYKILKDKHIYVPAMKLMAWKHFWGMTSGAGITVHHLIGWMPVYGGVSLIHHQHHPALRSFLFKLMKKFATHMTWMLVFLSLPLEVVSIARISRCKCKDHPC